MAAITCRDQEGRGGRFFRITDLGRLRRITKGAVAGHEGSNPIKPTPGNRAKALTAIRDFINASGARCTPSTCEENPFEELIAEQEHSEQPQSTRDKPPGIFGGDATPTAGDTPGQGESQKAGQEAADASTVKNLHMTVCAILVRIRPLGCNVFIPEALVVRKEQQQ